MGFTTPCFIREDTEYLREKLKKLGYTPFDDDKRDGLVADKSGYMYSILENNLISSTYNCGVNENLFLAIAALRDDTNENQWFICDVNHWDRSDNGEATVYAEIGEWIFCKSNDDDCAQDNHYHKATVEELIEHFKGKEK